MTQYTTSKWDLADLFPSHDSQQMEEAFAKIDSAVKDFEGFREKLSPNMDIDEFFSLVKEQ